MIRKFRNEDLCKIMEIWLSENISAHSFISEKYWKENYNFVKKIIPQSEVYLYEDNKNILGFIGITGSYIAGIFVKKEEQSKGIGKELLNFVKKLKKELSLNVYEKNLKAVSFYKKENFFTAEESIDKATGEKEFFMIWKEN